MTPANGVREDRRASGELGQQRSLKRTQVLPSKRIDLAFFERAFAESSLTPTQLSRKSGVSREHISNLLNGHMKNSKNSLRVDTLVSLLAACGFELKMERKR